MQPKPELLMLKGLPASGKSTHARELVDKGYVRVNKDDLRKMLNNGQYSRPNEAAVLKFRDTIINESLQNGKNVVVDDTNFEQKHYDRLSEIAQNQQVNFRVLFIDTPLEDCIKRNEARADKVPLEVIYQMYNRHIAPLRNDKEINYDEELDECIIVDIDGTLAHISNGRSPYDARSSGADTVDDSVAGIVAMHYRHGYKVILFSGRGKLEGEEEATIQWLADNNIAYDALYLRPVGDGRKDTEIKEELFNTHIKGKYNPRFVIDDRPSVCRMWRRIGLKVLQVGDPHVEF